MKEKGRKGKKRTHREIGDSVFNHARVGGGGGTIAPRDDRARSLRKFVARDAKPRAGLSHCAACLLNGEEKSKRERGGREVTEKRNGGVSQGCIALQRYTVRRGMACSSSSGDGGERRDGVVELSDRCITT